MACNKGFHSWVIIITNMLSIETCLIFEYMRSLQYRVTASLQTVLKAFVKSSFSNTCSLLFLMCSETANTCLGTPDLTSTVTYTGHVDSLNTPALSFINLDVQARLLHPPMSMGRTLGVPPSTVTGDIMSAIILVLKPRSNTRSVTQH